MVSRYQRFLWYTFSLSLSPSDVLVPIPCLPSFIIVDIYSIIIIIMQILRQPTTSTPTTTTTTTTTIRPTTTTTTTPTKMMMKWMPYDFGWGVNDPDTGNQFSQKEESDGKVVSKHTLKSSFFSSAFGGCCPNGPNVAKM